MSTGWWYLIGWGVLVLLLVAAGALRAFDRHRR